MKVENIEPSGATVRLFLAIDNKNNIDLLIDNMKHTVYLEKNKVLETTINDHVHIKPREKTIVEFPLNISFVGLQDNLVEIWKKKKIEYHVDSQIFVKSAVGLIPFDLKYDDVIELPPLPDISIEEVKIESMTFSEINMVVSVLIENNDKVKLQMLALDYDLTLNNMEIARGLMETSKKTLGFKNTENKILIKIPVKMKLLSLKRSITDMFKKGEIDYKIHLNLKGNSVYGDYNIPLDKSGLTRVY